VTVEHRTQCHTHPCRATAQMGTAVTVCRPAQSLQRITGVTARALPVHNLARRNAVLRQAGRGGAGRARGGGGRGRRPVEAAIHGLQPQKRAAVELLFAHAKVAAEPARAHAHSFSFKQGEPRPQRRTEPQHGRIPALAAPRQTRSEAAARRQRSRGSRVRSLFTRRQRVDVVADGSLFHAMPPIDPRSVAFRLRCAARGAGGGGV